MVELKLNKVLFLPLLSLYLPSSSYSAPTALRILFQLINQHKVGARHESIRQRVEQIMANVRIQRL